MSKKHFSWLLIATVVIGLVVVLLPGKTGKESDIEVTSLLPGFAEQVNSVDQVQVVGAGGITLATLKRQDQAWVVEEFHNYPADWNQLRTLLAALAQAKVVEPKTSNPDYFDRLGVDDVANEGSKATLLRVSGPGGQHAVLVGNAAEGRDGRYVRLADGDRALLIDQQLELPADAKGWLQRDIVNISDAEVVEFSSKQADGSEIRASKASADDDDFVLQDIPEGREIQSAWSVNSMANALSNLQLDAVVAADTVDFSTASQFRLLTADGLEVLAEVADAGEQKWLRLSAQVYAVDNAAQDAEPATDAAPDDEAAGSLAAGEEGSNASVAEGSTTAEKADTPPNASERAAEINQRVQGWAYAIPGFKADTMSKRMEDLLKPLPEADDTSE
jgi:hypothetical protein